MGTCNTRIVQVTNNTGGGNNNADANLVLTKITHADGLVQADGTATFSFGSTVSRLSQGRYQITYAAPHPQGANNAPVAVALSEPNLDQRRANIDDITATGFQVVITTDDNDNLADFLIDHPFTYSVSYEANVLVGA